MAAQSPYSGRVLGPSGKDSGWWDSVCFSGAVVLRPQSKPSESSEPERPQPGGESVPGPDMWRMYYYGRDTLMWNKGVAPLGQVPTGRIGMATSRDGIEWTRFKGPLPSGAILDPSDDDDAFDSVHIAVSDVVRVPSPSEGDTWRLFYSGSGLEVGRIPGMPAEKAQSGVRFRIGAAESADGVHFRRANSGRPILELGPEGAWDNLGTAWPRVLPPPAGDTAPGEWLMSYHAFQAREGPGFPIFTAGTATSADGATWAKRGSVLSAGEPGSWDEQGVSVRSVARTKDGYAMFYEGSNTRFQFAIGLATSADGVTWRKAEGIGPGPGPGGPILTARVGENVWDNVIVGTPYVVPMPDGSFWMYFLGVGKLEGQESSRQGIGLAVSEASDYTKWTRFGN